MSSTNRIDLGRRLDSLKNKLSKAKEEVKLLTSQVKALEQAIQIVDGDTPKLEKRKTIFALGELKALVLDKLSDLDTAKDITEYILQDKELDKGYYRKVYMSVSNTLAKLRDQGIVETTFTDDSARIHYKLSSPSSLTTND